MNLYPSEPPTWATRSATYAKVVAGFLLAVGGLMGILVWCVACLTAAAWAVDRAIPGDTVFKRAVLMAALIGALWFAIWTLARLSHSRL